MDDEKILKIICQILDKLYCSEAKITLREFYLKGEEINLETKINFNVLDATNFFQEISNSKNFSFGKHAFSEFKKEITIKELVDKIYQLTTDPLFINSCPNWPRSWGNIDKIKNLSIDQEFNELLDFAF